MLAKKEIVAKYQLSPKDTGSPEVQVALLSGAIEQLNSHFQVNKKDNHSRQGLLKKVALRRKLLKYLKRVDTQRYVNLIRQLGLRG
jgi:small subunit ribosomal protein S15